MALHYTQPLLMEITPRVHSMVHGAAWGEQKQLMISTE